MHGPKPIPETCHCAVTQPVASFVDIDREFLERRNVRLARLKISWVTAWPPPASVNDLTVGQISFGAQ
jgi:hypothetical protein